MLDFNPSRALQFGKPDYNIIIEIQGGIYCQDFGMKDILEI